MSRGVSRELCIAGIQSRIDLSTPVNLERLRSMVQLAVKQGADLVLLPELFETHYFCKQQNDENFALAHEVDAHPSVQFFQRVAKDLKVCLPLSIYEKSGPHYYNTVVVIDDRGYPLGKYRKSHIPDGPGYQEKFYFRPGDTGFKVWDFKGIKFGVGICWDQWFPEAAREMLLQGAELLLYPTAIGSEPESPEMDTSKPWQRVMVGHAVANAAPVMAINRIGQEGEQSYYGNSFICDEKGDFLDEGSRDEEKILISKIDFDRVAKYRSSFGFFRDRRPDLYTTIAKTSD